MARAALDGGASLVQSGQPGQLGQMARQSDPRLPRLPRPAILFRRPQASPDPFCRSRPGQACPVPGARDLAAHLRDGERGHAIRGTLRPAPTAGESGRTAASGIVQSQQGAIMGTDLRDAFRQLRKAAGFTLAAVVTLALAIGANTAIYQLIDAVMFRPLPAHEPERLVRIDLIENGKPRPF